MPTTRRTPQVADDDQPTADVPTVFDVPTATDFAIDVPTAAADTRADALAALLQQQPKTMVSDLAPPAQPRIVPPLNNVEVEWTGGTVRLLVWSNHYARMDGESDRKTARRGDTVLVPDDARTQSDLGYGYLIPVPQD